MSEQLSQFSEKRLVGTLLSRRPHRLSFIVAMGVVLVVGAVTMLNWSGEWGSPDLLSANRRLIFGDGEYWRVVTAVLIHKDMGHYLSNMLLLFILGYFIYGYFGFWAHPVTTFSGACFVNLLAISSYSEKVFLLGASGWVFLLGGFWLTLYFFIQRQYGWRMRIVRVVGVGLMLFFPSAFAPEVSYRTHYIGLVVGVFLGIFYFFLNRKGIRNFERYQVTAPDGLEV